MSILTQGAPAPTDVASSPFVPSGTPHLYILATQDRSRLKLGRTQSDFNRIVSLCYRYPEIDLSRSVMIGVDDASLETVLHNVFGLRRTPLPGGGDGHTEWFTGDFVEEVLDFIARIGEVRGKTYPVVRNLDALVQAQRARCPKGPRPPREDKDVRQTRAAQEAEALHNQVLEATEQAIARLASFGFDTVVRGERHCYLARSVLREAEPDAWEMAWPREATFKSRELVDAGRINVTVGASSCTFSLLDTPYCTVLSEQRAHETFRIGQGPDERLLADEPNPIDAAFARLWSTLAHLPVRSLETRLAMARRARRHRGTPIRRQRIALGMPRRLKSSV